jgi:hypothetical protein
MPQSVIPVKADFKSFLAAAVIMMLVWKLLFVIVGQILSRTWAFDSLVAWVRHSRSDGLLLPSSAKECGGCLQCMKRRRPVQRRSEETEVDDVVVV